MTIIMKIILIKKGKYKLKSQLIKRLYLYNILYFTKCMFKNGNSSDWT